MASSWSQSQEEFMRRLEYIQWRNTVPDLYDLAFSYGLEWPSLTVEWVPGRRELPEENCYVQDIILGTYPAPNYLSCLMIAEFKYPREKSGSFGIRIIEQILHRGGVNRAHCMPTKPSIIATRSTNRKVYVFDRERKDMLTLRGHEKEGFPLSWSPLKSGLLLSAADDATICLWDVNMKADAMQTFKIGEVAVQDVAWHRKNGSLFGSVGDDNQLHTWDLRSREHPQSVRAHECEVGIIASLLVIFHTPYGIRV